MGYPNRIPIPKNGDWDTLRKSLALLSGNFGLGCGASPRFYSLKLTSLTANRLVSSNSSKTLISTDLNSWVTGTANEVGITDDGDGTITVGLEDEVIVTTSLSSPSIFVTGETASRLIALDATNEIVSTNASAWIDGTTNQVIRTDDGDGTVTLSTPQDIHTSATPTFSTINLTTQASAIKFGTVNMLVVYNSSDIFLGQYAGGNVSGSTQLNTCFGTYAGYNLKNTAGLEGKANVFIGYEAGKGSVSGITGYRNIGVGYQSLYAVSTGQYNIGFGFQSLLALTTGTYNVAIGASSLKTCLTGSNNVAFGAFALEDCTSSNNIGIGTNSGKDISSGTENVCIGGNSGDAITTTSYNTIIGFSALSAAVTPANNLAMGSYAMATGTGSPQFNIALGAYSLYSVTGTYNIAIGYRAAFAVTSGGSNIAIGFDALRLAQTSSNNLAIGGSSLYNTSTGAYNVAIGGSSMVSNLIGGYCTAVGYQALRTNNANNNCGLGYQAGYSNSAGTGNIFIGYQAGYNETGSNKLYIDNSNTATPLVYGDFSTDTLTINDTLKIAGMTVAGFVKNAADGTLSGGNSLASTDISDFDEAAQDAVGTILADSASIDFTYTDATPEITAVVLPAGVDHDSLNNFAANEHIDHTSVTLTAGVGLTGGGDISANRTFDLDINGLVADTTPDGSADYLATYDDSGSTHKKVLIDDLLDLGGAS